MAPIRTQDLPVDLAGYEADADTDTAVVKNKKKMANMKKAAKVIKQEVVTEKIPRPANPWICYRTMRCAQLSGTHPDGQPGVSRMIADEWHAKTRAEQQPWYDQAERIKEAHKIKYPDWTYKPDRKAQASPVRSRKPASMSKPASKGGRKARSPKKKSTPKPRTPPPMILDHVYDPLFDPEHIIDLPAYEDPESLPSAANGFPLPWPNFDRPSTPEFLVGTPERSLGTPELSVGSPSDASRFSSPSTPPPTHTLDARFADAVKMEAISQLEALSFRGDCPAPFKYGTFNVQRVLGPQVQQYCDTILNTVPAVSPGSPSAWPTPADIGDLYGQPRTELPYSFALAAERLRRGNPDYVPLEDQFAYTALNSAARLRRRAAQDPYPAGLVTGDEELGCAEFMAKLQLADDVSFEASATASQASGPVFSPEFKMTDPASTVEPGLSWDIFGQPSLEHDLFAEL